MHVDNMTAVAYLRNLGGTFSPKCYEITLQIWEWAEQNRIWLSSTHFAGIDNLEADSLSRNRETLSKNKFNVLNGDSAHWCLPDRQNGSRNLPLTFLHQPIMPNVNVLPHGRRTLVPGKLTLSLSCGVTSICMPSSLCPTPHSATQG